MVWVHILPAASYKEVKMVEHNRMKTSEFIIPEIGIAEIDSDHAEIMRLIKSTINANDKTQFFDFVVQALDYIHKHFAAEEAFMESIQYPGRRIHGIEHKSLRDFVKVYLKPTLQEMTNREEIVRECVKAFKFHVVEHDVPLANYILAQGLKFDKDK